MSTIQLFFLLVTFSQVISMYIMHNSADVRVVGSSYSNSNCAHGRVEFYNGIRWGPFARCSSSSISSNYQFLGGVCRSLGWSSYYTYYVGQDNYVSGTSAISSEYFLTSQNSYVFNKYDTCNSSYSCTSSVTDVCGKCGIDYSSSVCYSTNSYIVNNYIMYIRCTSSSISTSSRDSYCRYYSTYADFDSYYNSISWSDCENSCTTTSLGAIAAAIVTVIVWIIIICCICICIGFCCACQRRRYTQYGYYGWGTRRYGGTYGWSGGVTPAFSAGYNAGQIQQNQVNTTTTTVVQQRVPVVVQGQQPIVMQGQQRMPVIMQGQQPVQYVQQPMVVGQPVQYVQQPVTGQQTQYVQQPITGQQTQYAQSTQMVPMQQVQAQAVQQQPVQYVQGQQPVVGNGTAVPAGVYPVLSEASAPAAFSEGNQTFN